MVTVIFFYANLIFQVNVGLQTLQFWNVNFWLNLIGEPSWDSGKGRLHGLNDDNLSEVSASAANVSHDGKHSLLEFAMR